MCIQVSYLYINGRGWAAGARGWLYCLGLQGLAELEVEQGLEVLVVRVDLPPHGLGDLVIVRGGVQVSPIVVVRLRGHGRSLVWVVFL